MNLKNISENITLIQNEASAKIDAIIDEELKFIKGDKFYYSCSGSGYYLIYDEIRNEHIIFKIVSKGMQLKNKRFKLHWCNADKLEKLEK